jgi:Tol biopolymer transport system component
MSRRESLDRQAFRGPWGLLTVAAFLAVHVGSAGRADEDAPKADVKSSQAKSADGTGDPALIGAWQALSLSVRDKNGNPEVFGGRGQHPCNVVFDEKTLTLRVGAEVIATMSYTAYSNQNPCVIDVKSDDGAMVGIYQKAEFISNNQRQVALNISLNDAAKGRPENINRQDCGLFLGLKRFATLPLFVADADGGNTHQILALPEYTAMGSPDWSRDGAKIAFDATRSLFGEDWNSSHVFVVNADGSSPKDLGLGAMPSWSHDNKQLTYVEFQPQHGVGIMNADGTNRQLIDSAGWGSQWCPLRNEIAIATSQDGRPNLCIYNVASKKRRTLLEKTYRQVCEGFTWSPDGKWICFKGDLPEGGSEVAAVSVEGEKQGFKVLLPKSAQPESGNVSKTMAWGPKNQILVTMQTKADRRLQFYLLDSAGAETPRRFPGFSADWTSDDMAWSPDGKKVVFTAIAAPAR